MYCNVCTSRYYALETYATLNEASRMEAIAIGCPTCGEGRVNGLEKLRTQFPPERRMKF